VAGELSKSRHLLLVEEMNGNDTAAIRELCIMDNKPIITCKYSDLMLSVNFMFAFV
jgi:hypothetical protein